MTGPEKLMLDQLNSKRIKDLAERARILSHEFSFMSPRQLDQVQAILDQTSTRLDNAKEARS